MNVDKYWGQTIFFFFLSQSETGEKGEKGEKGDLVSVLKR